MNLNNDSGYSMHCMVGDTDSYNLINPDIAPYFNTPNILMPLMEPKYGNLYQKSAKDDLYESNKMYSKSTEEGKLAAKVLKSQFDFMTGYMCNETPGLGIAKTKQYPDGYFLSKYVIENLIDVSFVYCDGDDSIANLRIWNIYKSSYTERTLNLNELDDDKILLKLILRWFNIKDTTDLRKSKFLDGIRALIYNKINFSTEQYTKFGWVQKNDKVVYIYAPSNITSLTHFSKPNIPFIESTVEEIIEDFFKTNAPMNAQLGLLLIHSLCAIVNSVVKITKPNQTVCLCYGEAADLSKVSSNILKYTGNSGAQYYNPQTYPKDVISKYIEKVSDDFLIVDCIRVTEKNYPLIYELSRGESFNNTPIKAPIALLQSNFKIDLGTGFLAFDVHNIKYTEGIYQAIKLLKLKMIDDIENGKLPIKYSATTDIEVKNLVVIWLKMLFTRSSSTLEKVIEKAITLEELLVSSSFSPVTAIFCQRVGYVLATGRIESENIKYQDVFLSKNQDAYIQIKSNKFTDFCKSIGFETPDITHIKKELYSNNYLKTYNNNGSVSNFTTDIRINGKPVSVYSIKKELFSLYLDSVDIEHNATGLQTKKLRIKNNNKGNKHRMPSIIINR